MNSHTPRDDEAPSRASLTDREVLERWRRDRHAENLRPLLERYGAFVYSSAYRRTGDAEVARDVTQAVFLVLARRAHRLRKAVLAGWLFQVTSVACVRRIGRLRRLWDWISRRKRINEPPADGSLWVRIGPKIDHALGRLSSRQRNAVLLCSFLNHDLASAARILHTSELRVQKRLQRGMQKLAKRFHTRHAPVASADLVPVCAREGCCGEFPEPLFVETLRAIENRGGRRPLPKLARRTLNSLAWRRWQRRCIVGAAVFCILLAIAGGAIWNGSPTGRTWLFSELQIWMARYRNFTAPEIARPWPAHPGAPQFDARLIRDAEQLYRTTNIWPVHLTFTREQWKALEPKRISVLGDFVLPDNRIVLRNPKARRNGILGVMGLEYGWSQAGCEFGQLWFTNVAARVKGNIGSLMSKRPFRLDLNKFVRGQKLGGLDELTFDNLFWDYSYMSEPLAYEFFRDAGVPAPRTAYAWLSVSVTGQWEHKPFGLYGMEEAVNAKFVAEHFGSRKTPLFKPSTYKLFHYLGADWSAYGPIYDLKTEATPKERQRLIDFAHLLTFASGQEFSQRVGDFLDLDELARFLAGLVLIPNYDSILVTGQNFYLYLDQGSNKFGFIPWDLDASWGNFWIGLRAEQQQSSIWHPWVGEVRFLERVMAVEEFRRIYRTHLEDFVGRLYVPERLNQRIDAMIDAIRDPIAAESPVRLDKFEQTVGLKPLGPPKWGTGFDLPAYDLKQFIAGRARSVRSQLAGESQGIILKHPKLL